MNEGVKIDCGICRQWKIKYCLELQKMLFDLYFKHF